MLYYFTFSGKYFQSNESIDVYCQGKNIGNSLPSENISLRVVYVFEKYKNIKNS